MSKVILVIGNVVDGLRFVGPFEGVSLAIEYAEQNLGDDWVVAPLHEEDVGP